MTLIVEDFYGALTRLADEIAAQATSRRGFCPTGEGGGIDNSCGSGDGGGGGGGAASPQVKAWAEKKFAEPEHAKAFAEWFGDSKTVDDKGEPLVLYHGTASSFDEFKVDTENSWSTALGFDTYFHSENVATASTYANQSKDGQIMENYVSMKNPLEIDAGGGEWFDAASTAQDTIRTYRTDKEREYLEHQQAFNEKYPNSESDPDSVPDSAWSALQKQSTKIQQHILDNPKLYAGAKRQPFGYDGIIVKNVLDNTAAPVSEDIPASSPFTTVYVVFKPTQIKSATGNRGTFDPKNPKITRSSRAWCPGASPPDNSCSPKNKGNGKSDDKGGGKGGSKKSGKVHDGTGLSMNDDGTVTVYHHTSATNADKIKATGKLKSAGEPHVYVTTEAGANTGYGDTVVPIKVNPDDLELDDEFPGGRKDFKMSVGRPGGEVKVGLDESEGSDTGGAAKGSASKAVKAWAEKAFSNPSHAENFVRWFGDSKVVGDNGEPLVVHKGMPRKDWKTGKDIEAVQSTNGPWAGFFSDDKAVADRFAQAFKFSGDTQTLSGYAVIKNPHVIDAGGKPAKSVQFDQVVDGPSGPRVQVAPRIKEIVDSGRFDGIIIKNTSDEGTVFVPFNPEGVKSSDNSGAFDPKSKNYKRSESRDCGANAEGGGGFQPGNSCGKGEGGGAASSGGDGGGSGGGSVEPAKAGDGPLVKAARDEHKKALDKFRKGIETANAKATEKHASAMEDHIVSKENLAKQWDEVNRLAIETDNLTSEAQADPKNEAKWQKVRDAGQALTQARVGLEPFERAEEAAKKSKEKAAEGVRTATAKAFAKEISAVDKEDGLTPKERKTISDAITRHNQRGESFAGTGFESEQMARSAYAAGVRGDGQAYLREHVNNSIHASALQGRIEYVDGVRANAAGGVLVRTDGVEVGLVGTCKFDPTDSQRTFIHEFGHQIEHGNPEARSLCEDFLRSRVGSESPKSFKELYPTAAYRDDERGLMDDFAKAHVAVGYDEDEAIRRAYYVGKDYSGMAGKNGLLGTTPTEILSMGMELMYRDAVAFSKADPEWFDLVSGVVTGRLLSKTRAKRKK